MNKLIPGYTVGQVVEVQCDERGTPLKEFWRRKLRDARLDECCEVVKEVAKVVAAPEPRKDEEND